MKNHRLFVYAYYDVLDSGGDGEILIGFRDQNIEDVADEFRKYLPESWQLMCHEGYISFFDDQESITLATADVFEKTESFGTRILTF